LILNYDYLEGKNTFDFLGITKGRRYDDFRVYHTESEIYIEFLNDHDEGETITFEECNKYFYKKEI
jgi:hypothetical protein